MSISDCKPWQGSECSSRFLKFDLNKMGKIDVGSFTCFDMPWSHNKARQSDVKTRRGNRTSKPTLRYGFAAVAHGVRHTKMNTRLISKHLLIGLVTPVAFLVNGFLVPEPYSHPLIYVGLAPSKLMPFLENRELMTYLTELVFGRMTPNFSPIQAIFLIMFWFFSSTLVSVLMARFKQGRRNA